MHGFVRISIKRDCNENSLKICVYKILIVYEDLSGSVTRSGVAKIALIN